MIFIYEESALERLHCVKSLKIKASLYRVAIKMRLSSKYFYYYYEEAKYYRLLYNSVESINLVGDSKAK